MKKNFTAIPSSLPLFLCASLQSFADTPDSKTVFDGFPLIQAKILQLESMASEGADLEFFSVSYVPDKNPAARQCQDISAQIALQNIKRLFTAVCQAVSDAERTVPVEDAVMSELTAWVGEDDYRLCYGSLSRNYSRSEYAAFKKKGTDQWIEFEVGFED